MLSSHPPVIKLTLVQVTISAVEEGAAISEKKRKRDSPPPAPPPSDTPVPTLDEETEKEEKRRRKKEKKEKREKERKEFTRESFFSCVPCVLLLGLRYLSILVAVNHRGKLECEC